MSDFKIYDSCDILTMARFIKCLVHGDLQQLLIEGEATNEELEQYFFIIKTQYITLLENKDSKYIVTLMREVWNSRTKHWEINQLLKALRLAFDSGLLGNEDITAVVKEIRSYGYRENLNMNDKQQFLNSLKLIESKSKRLLSDAAASEVELKKLQEAAGSKEIEKSDFDKQKITLSRFQGYPIDFEKTTVLDFCLMAKDYERHIEAKHAVNNNLLSKR